MPCPSGSDAFRWLDAHMIASLDTPDEAFDWVYMLHDEDWPLLEAAWPDRSPQWREACTYILGKGLSRLRNGCCAPP